MDEGERGVWQEEREPHGREALEDALKLRKSQLEQDADLQDREKTKPKDKDRSEHLSVFGSFRWKPLDNQTSNIPWGSSVNTLWWFQTGKWLCQPRADQLLERETLKTAHSLGRQMARAVWSSQVGDRLGIREAHPGTMEDYRGKGVEVGRLHQTGGRPIGWKTHVDRASAMLVCLRPSAGGSW